MASGLSGIESQSITVRDGRDKMSEESMVDVVWAARGLEAGSLSLNVCKWRPRAAMRAMEVCRACSAVPFRRSMGQLMSTSTNFSPARDRIDGRSKRFASCAIG